MATCGAAGSACGACSPVTADGCSGTGACQCGTSGRECSGGRHCVRSACVCVGATCDDGTTCQPSAPSHCGVDGVRCTACGFGQGCSAGGACVCDASSCAAPGVCEGTFCVVRTCGESGECGTYPVCGPCTCPSGCGTPPFGCRPCACIDSGWTCGIPETGCYMCPPDDVILPPRGRGAAEPPAP